MVMITLLFQDIFFVSLGKVTAGNLTGFIIYTLGFFLCIYLKKIKIFLLAIGDAFSTITTEYTELMKASGSSERVFHLIDRYQI